MSRSKKRKPTSKRLRFEVFTRDGFTCRYCGRHPPSVVLEVDHVVPVADDGETEIENLVTSCFDCNRGKSDRRLSDVPPSLELRGEAIREKEEQLRGYYQAAKARRDRIERDCYEVADVFVAAFELEGITRAELRSIQTFVEKLGLPECKESIEIAVARKGSSHYDCFKYFCGICWSKIKSGEFGGIE